MKTYTINGIKVYDYHVKPSAVRTPHDNIRPIIAGFDPAFGESRTVITLPPLTKKHEQSRAKRPTLIKRLHTWWSTRNEPAKD